MKRIFQLASVALVVLLLATSCGKTPSHINVIPGDAFGVMLLKPGEMDRDALVKQIESNDEYKDAMEEIREESEVLADIFDDFIKDPNSLGLDMEAEMYLFTAPNDDEIMFGYVMAMKKASAFEDVLKKLIAEMDMGIDIEDADGFKKVVLPMDAGIIIWDKEKLLVLGSDGEFDAEATAKKLMNQKASESVTSNKDFAEFYSNCLGFNIWVSSNIDNMKEQIQMAETFLDIELNDNFAHLHLGWDKKIGEFQLVFKMRVNEDIRNIDPEKVQELMEETDMLDGIQGLIGGRSSDDDYYYDEEWEEEWADELEATEEITDEELEALFDELEAELEKVEE